MTVTEGRYTITASKRELQELRRALCERSMRLLSQAHKSQAEAEALGVEDHFSRIPMEQRELVRNMIDNIDSLDE